MFSLKYYVFLMVGIFLALGLGIMIGVSLESKDLLENQQTGLARQIEERFVLLRNETDQLKEELSILSFQRKESEELTEVLFAETVKDRLAGINIAVISFEQNEEYNNILEFIASTGALIQSRTQINCTSNENFESLPLAAYAVATSDDIVNALVEELLFSIMYGGSSPLIRELQELNILSTTPNYEIPSDVILLLGSGKNSLTHMNSRYDTLLIQEAVNTGVPIIAIESQDIVESFIGEYIKYGISTVDHVNSFYGKLALVSILAGNQGNYGLGSSAQGILPEPLFSNEYQQNNIVYGAEE